MILYFSGTGNSRYVAQGISKVTGDEIVSINDLLKSGSRDDIKSAKPLVFVVPTYGWRIPKVVEEFIKEVNFTGINEAYFIMTCGSEAGNAVNYIKKLCADKNFKLKGFTSIAMPENYIAMFDVPDKVKSDKIIQGATKKIQAIAEKINEGKSLESEEVGVADKVKSTIVNPLFYMFAVSTKGFYSTDKCNGCTKCAKVCPLNNINIVNKKPQWGTNCTHCMACICRCPSEAIEYKNKSKGKRRYYNNETFKI